jgi:urease gamma subunit
MSDLTTGWRKRQIALDIKAENARELGLDYEQSIMERAREVNAVFDVMAMGRHDGILFTSKELEAFANLVRAQEREKLQLAAECYRMRKHKGVCNEKTKSNEAN